MTEICIYAEGGAYARIIADSIPSWGDLVHRLTTFEVRFWRPVLAEFNTHRTFSRNSASSRAIPLRKQLEKVTEVPAGPVVWAAEQKGMQGGEETEDLMAAGVPVWENAAAHAVKMASLLGQAGIHKSIANRLLEPFLMHTAVVTATAWQNFFKLRLDTLAQPEIRVAAEAMKAAYDLSTPHVLDPGDYWHLPYLRPGEITEIEEAGLDPRQISAARCARVSYETQDGKRDFAEDLRLYKTLTENGHASPLEHVATPAPDNQHQVVVEPRIWGDGVITQGQTLTLPRYGNLLGWHQLRFDAEGARGYQAYS